MNERELVDERRSVAELIKKRYHGKKNHEKKVLLVLVYSVIITIRRL